jgi:hypothetical protein
MTIYSLNISSMDEVVDETLPAETPVEETVVEAVEEALVEIAPEAEVTEEPVEVAETPEELEV